MTGKVFGFTSADWIGVGVGEGGGATNCEIKISNIKVNRQGSYPIPSIALFLRPKFRLIQHNVAVEVKPLSRCVGDLEASI